MANRDDETNDESDDTDISLSISPSNFRFVIDRKTKDSSSWETVEYWSFHQSLSPIDKFSDYFYKKYLTSPIFSVDSLEDTIISSMESKTISDVS